MYHWVNETHEYTIFLNLNDCDRLEILLCTNCYIQFLNVDLEWEAMDLPGHMCSKWLLRRALQSLRWYTGPLYYGDREAVEECYRDVTHMSSPTRITLDPQPLDHNVYTAEMFLDCNLSEMILGQVHV